MAGVLSAYAAGLWKNVIREQASELKPRRRTAQLPTR
jgi:hypothetical protein